MNRRCSIFDNITFFELGDKVSSHQAVGARNNVPVSLSISIREITKLPNSEQSYKGKVKTDKYTVTQLDKGN
jgi:hypothetical protein